MKVFLVLILMSFSLMVQASDVRGKVVSVVKDDGGQKILMSQGSGKVSSTYLKNSHPSFEPIADLVTLAKEGNKNLIINVDDEYLRYVKSVSLEK